MWRCRTPCSRNRRAISGGDTTPCGQCVVYLWSVALHDVDLVLLHDTSDHVHQALRRERPTRIELASSAWKAEVLPLNYGRESGDSLTRTFHYPRQTGIKRTNRPAGRRFAEVVGETARDLALWWSNVTSELASGRG